MLRSTRPKGLEEEVCLWAAGTALLLLIVSALGTGLESRELTGQAATGPALRGLVASRTGTTSIVTLEAEGAFPPSSFTGTAIDNPPRIFFDFPGMVSKVSASTTLDDPLIRRVRVGLHSAKPRITRVVLDLVQSAPFKVVQQSPDRLMIVVGSETGARPATRTPPPAPSPAPAPPAVPARESANTFRPPRLTPVPPLPPPPATPASPPATAASRLVADRPPPAAPPPAPGRSHGSSGRATSAVLPKDVEKYRREVSGALDRLGQQRAFLAALDQLANQSSEATQLALNELEGVRQALATVRPPMALRPTHDLLLQSCTLGAMAARLRLDALRTGDEAVRRNSASAAAGSILLLDRACADLACESPSPDR
jgi:hypothetical protein